MNIKNEIARQAEKGNAQIGKVISTRTSLIHLAGLDLKNGDIDIIDHGKIVHDLTRQINRLTDMMV